MASNQINREYSLVVIFNMFQVVAEFARITMVPLLSTFMAKLDHYADHLRVFKKKGGTAKRNINLIMAAMDGVCILVDLD